MSVLYFHGFASSPKSQKIDLLRARLPELEFDTPDMNVPSFEKLDFEMMTRLGLERAALKAPQVIVGSSLGSLIALEVVRRGVKAPLVLIAPAVGIGERWITKLPQGDPVTVFNHALNADTPIHRRFFEQMRGIRPEEKAPASRVSIVMGRKDESVPFHLVREVWEGWQEGIVPGSRFIEIAAGDHSLVAYVDVLAREISSAAQ